MKLQARQIPAFLQQPAKECQGVLIYGPDAGLAREYAAKIAARIVADVRDPFSVAEISEERFKQQPAILTDELFALNLMGGQRLVRLETDNENAAKLLSDIFSRDVAPEAFLIVQGGDLSPRDGMRALFESHPKLAALPCYHDESQNLEALVAETFRKAGIRLEAGVMEYLLSHLGNDRQITRNELEKMVLYLGESKEMLQREAVLLIGESSEATQDDLLQAVTDGNLRQSEMVLAKLLREGGQPVQILRGFQRHFQRLHVWRVKMKASRQSADQVLAEHKPKLFFKLLPPLTRALNRWPQEALEKALFLQLEAERAMKETGAAPDSILRALVTELLVLGARLKRAA